MEDFLNEVENRHHIQIPGDDCYYFTKYEKDMKKMLQKRKVIT